MDRTTVSVSEEVADELHGMKRRGESYDDVLRRVLDLESEDAATESAEEPGIDTSTPTP
jgi:predicted CopG family antitoxin